MADLAQKQAYAKLALLAFVVGFVLFFSRPPGTTKAVALGDAVPNFTLKQNNGQLVSLQEYRGKVVVLNFWASWCGPCVEELPSLQKFAERYNGKGVQVIGVSLDEDANAYMKFLTDHEVNFMTMRDPTHNIAETYGTYKLPETYIISAKGTLLNKVIGETDWTSQEMTSYFDSILPGQEVTSLRH